MRYLNAVIVMVLLLLTGISKEHAANAVAMDAAPSDLVAAIKSYVEQRGSAFRGECTTVSLGVVGGLCYEATLRTTDGVAEVYLGLPFSDGAFLVLFAGAPFGVYQGEGWYAFTRPIPVCDDCAEVLTNADWSDVTGLWWYQGSTFPEYPGLVTSNVNSDGTGSMGAGRFGVATFQLTSFENGIAVGKLPTLEGQGGTIGSGMMAIVLLDDGTAVLTSTANRINVPLARSLP